MVENVVPAPELTLVLVGLSCSGKTTALESFRGVSAATWEESAVASAFFPEQLSPTERRIAVDQFLNFGSPGLVGDLIWHRYLCMAGRPRPRLVIVGGVRVPATVMRLRSKGWSPHIVAFQAREAVRWQRCQMRLRPDGPRTLAEFRSNDVWERSLGLEKLMQDSDTTLDAEQPHEVLVSQLQRLTARLLAIETKGSW